jgi:hypothetical protein
MAPSLPLYPAVSAKRQGEETVTSNSIVSPSVKGSDTEWLLEYRRFHDQLMRGIEDPSAAHAEPKRSGTQTPSPKKAA